MNPTENQGQVVIYQTSDGMTSIDVHLERDTVWLNQAQMVELFQRNQSVISRHVRNVFKEGELEEKGNMQKMHIPNSDKPVTYFNLDVVISVGYRVKSPRGTQFRIWATRTLKNHLIHGYTLNERRLREKGLNEARESIKLLAQTLERHSLIDEHDLLLKKVAERIDDDRVMHLLKLMLKASGKRGVPQGGVISPLLSNIYLNEVDKMLVRAKEVTRQGSYTYIPEPWFVLGLRGTVLPAVKALPAR